MSDRRCLLFRNKARRAKFKSIMSILYYNIHDRLPIFRITLLGGRGSGTVLLRHCTAIPLRRITTCACFDWLQRSRPKRKATDNLNWDIPDSLANCWFSQDHNDFCLVAKAVIMVFAVIGFVGVLLLIVCICWRSFGYHAYGYTETECRSSDCICGQDSA